MVPQDSILIKDIPLIPNAVILLQATVHGKYLNKKSKLISIVHLEFLVPITATTLIAPQNSVSIKYIPLIPIPKILLRSTVHMTYCYTRLKLILNVSAMLLSSISVANHFPPSTPHALIKYHVKKTLRSFLPS